VIAAETVNTATVRANNRPPGMARGSEVRELGRVAGAATGVPEVGPR